MRTVEDIGAKVYRKVVSPVYDADGRTYVAGCVIHGRGGAVSVRFLKYENGKGIIGKVKPSDEMVKLLRQYRNELKSWINHQDQLEEECATRSTDDIFKRYGRPRHRF